MPLLSIIGAIAANEAWGVQPLILSDCFVRFFRLNRAIVVSLTVRIVECFPFRSYDGVSSLGFDSITIVEPALRVRQRRPIDSRLGRTRFKSLLEKLDGKDHV